MIGAQLDQLKVISDVYVAGSSADASDILDTLHAAQAPETRDKCDKVKFFGTGPEGIKQFEQYSWAKRPTSEESCTGYITPGIARCNPT